MRNMVLHADLRQTALACILGGKIVGMGVRYNGAWSDSEKILKIIQGMTECFERLHGLQVSDMLADVRAPALANCDAVLQMRPDREKIITGR
jgi:hypothetical protein